MFLLNLINYNIYNILWNSEILKLNFLPPSNSSTPSFICIKYILLIIISPVGFRKSSWSDQKKTDKTGLKFIYDNSIFHNFLNWQETASRYFWFRSQKILFLYLLQFCFSLHIYFFFNNLKINYGILRFF